MALGKSEDRMSTKPVIPCALLVALMSVCSAQAQDMAAPPGTPAGTPRSPLMTGTSEVPPPTAILPPAKPDNWMTYTCSDCCGPVGGNGTIGYELFVRTGPSLNISGGFLKEVTSAGWTIEGGGRSLFFNPTHDRAITAELSISHTYNDGNRPNVTTPIILQPQGANTPSGFQVSVSSLQRTDVNASLGAEWYLLGNDQCTKPSLWLGADGGFRYGPSRLDLHLFGVNPGITYTRTSGINAGPFISVYSDLAWPCGSCLYLIGVRAEWDKSYMSMLPLENCNIQDVKLLLNLGVRF
jgi:hypothetical protein